MVVSKYLLTTFFSTLISIFIFSFLLILLLPLSPLFISFSHSPSLLYSRPFLFAVISLPLFLSSLPSVPKIDQILLLLCRWCRFYFQLRADWCWDGTSQYPLSLLIVLAVANPKLSTTWSHESLEGSCGTTHMNAYTTSKPIVLSNIELSMVNPWLGW